MTMLQLNAEIYRNLALIADDEDYLKRAAKYLGKLATQKKTDDACMTEEDFFAKIERAEQQAKRGEGMEMLPGEDLKSFLIRNGYAI